MLWSNVERVSGYLEPWTEFDRMRRGFPRLVQSVTVDFPAVNIWVAYDSVVVTSEIPGIRPEEIEISVTGKNLTLKGSRQPEELSEGETYHRRERWYGRFSKTIEMPFAVEVEKIEATFKKGIFRVVLPKAEAEKSKKITVKSE